MKDTPVDLHEKEAYFCFGMSKMTLVHDVEDGYDDYFKMKRVEFYEFLGRAAAARYTDKKYDSLSLASKLEKVLDMILPQFGMTRVEVGEEVETASAAFSESVDSVDFDALDFDPLDPSITLMEDEDDYSRLQMEEQNHYKT